MKELTIEQKAKRYDEAIERAKNFIENGDESERTVAESIFAGIIVESDDERIKKALVEYFKGNTQQILGGFDNKDVLAWVEKQCEQKTVDEIAKEVCKNRASATAFLKSAGIMNEKGELAEQYRQDGQKSYASKTMNEKGDFDNGFIRMMEKEQTAAWSEKDKEMSRFIGNAITADDASVYLKSKGIEVIDAHVWLDELKDRVQPQPKQEWSEDDETKLKSAYALIRNTLIRNTSLNGNKDIIDSTIDWLKSLKDRYTWKPSDEQIKAVRLARAFVTDNFDDNPTLSEILIELEKQLKKLREK